MANLTLRLTTRLRVVTAVLAGAILTGLMAILAISLGWAVTEAARLLAAYTVLLAGLVGFAGVLGFGVIALDARIQRRTGPLQ